ncbi:MAG: UDP-glucose 4-epimerase GalE [Pseudomonadota bacterium]
MSRPSSTKVLLTGGAGYIGSHAYVAFLGANCDVVLLDNFSNSSSKVLDRLEKITGTKPNVHQVDIRDKDALTRALLEEQPNAVVHFAGLKAVGESVARPVEYYDNNVSGTINLLHAMRKAGVKNLVFSSSATVYGDPASVPITEDFPRSATNPYGRSKLIIEDILIDLVSSDPSWKVAMLRYFNPVGAHDSGLIGENPTGIPNNLMPYVSQVAVGQREKLSVFGGDYPTKDGTGVRDYIHVVDLAEGHVLALRALAAWQEAAPLTVNLGTGAGSSVLELVSAFERASNRNVPYEIVARRSGDVAECFADPSLAERLLGWRAERDVDVMCVDSWRWQSQNPNGFN